MQPAIRTSSSRPDADVQLWIAEVTALDDPDHYARCWDVLSAGEQLHAGRFRFERDRKAYVASHSLRRQVLSRMAGVEPEQWQFSVNEYGRPRIAFPLPDDALEFNCSTCADLAVCAVTQGARVGVDIERLDRRVPEAVAGSAFASEEIAALAALPPPERGRRFFTLWTLKEAYLKARGVGLSLPLDSMAFEVEDGPDLLARMTYSMAEDCGEWQVMLLSPTPSHIASVCVQRLPGRDRTVEIRKWMGGHP